MSGPISMFLPTALVVALSVPLALQLVPPNRYYGFRTARTLADRDVWFRVNRVGGWGLIIAGSLSTCVYLLAPQLASGRSLAGVLVLVLSVLAALAVAGVYARTRG